MTNTLDEIHGQVLFISNGHGEDLIAARLAKLLKATAPELQVIALPVVGVGTAFVSAGIPLLILGTNLPSGGFVRNGLRNLFIDLRAGLIDLTRRQIKVLKEARKDTTLAVCVGDIYGLLLAGWFLQRPTVFLPTAKSDYVAPHWPVEINLMRHFSIRVFPRDVNTAESLSRKGVPAVFAGNVMMDCLDYLGGDFEGRGDEWTIAILPGGRIEAYENMRDITAAVLEFEDLVQTIHDCKQTRYLVALSGGLSFTDMAKVLKPLEWEAFQPDAVEMEQGILGHLEYQKQDRLVRLTIAQGRFADILKACNIVVGMAGTANEQAAGLGKPVITFVGRGPQFTKKFVKTQKKLLGDAICVVKREPKIIALELLQLLSDWNRRELMAKTGKERMGEPGGASRIIEEILKEIKKINGN